MEIPQAFYRTSIKALITDEQGRFLLVKETNNFWDMPGGGLDFGENPTEGVEREIEEEMKLDVLSVAKNPSYFVTAYIERTKTWIVNVFYKVEVKNLDFTPSDECVEIKFFTAEGVLNDTSGFISENIKEFAKQYTA